MDYPHRPDFTARNHRPCLADEGIAGVSVHDSEDHVALSYHLGESLRVAGVRGQRLLAEDIEAALDESAGDLEMAAVRGRDANEITSVGTRFLGGRHMSIVVVNPVVGQSQRSGEGAAALRIDVECAADEFEAIVEPAGNAVAAADRASAPAADHAEPELPRRHVVVRHVPPRARAGRSWRDLGLDAAFRSRPNARRRGSPSRLEAA